MKKSKCEVRVIGMWKPAMLKLVRNKRIGAFVSEISGDDEMGYDVILEAEDAGVFTSSTLVASIIMLANGDGESEFDAMYPVSTKDYRRIEVL